MDLVLDQIAFVGENDGDSDVYLMNIDGSGLVNLSNTSEDEGGPSWSPDGNQLVFHSNQTGTYQIHIVNADGSNQSQLLYSSVHDQWPHWSPSGDKIAFTRWADHDGS